MSATAHLIDTSISPFGMIISQERLRGVADCVGLLGEEAVEHGGLPWGPADLYACQAPGVHPQVLLSANRIGFAQPPDKLGVDIVGRGKAEVMHVVAR